MLGLSLLRTTIGLITVVATRAVAKSLSYGALKALVAKRADTLHSDNEENNSVQVGFIILISFV